ncbi:MAG: TIGR03087 family PEP-CTERM/XrtA system glycosyltransferase [Vicinamibacterales bacterium]
MNVLMLTHRLPYAPNRGDRRRAYYLLRFLAERHDVHLISLVHDADEAARALEMSALVRNVSIVRRRRVGTLAAAAMGLIGDTPLTHLLLDSPALPSTIEAVTRRFRPDVVLAYCSGLARLALEPPLRDIPLVLDLVDVDSGKWHDYAARSRPPLSWIYSREARVLGAFEARAARAASATLVVNHRERDALAALAPDANAIVVPNGIDVELLRSPRPPSSAERVLFCGVMDYRPNREGAEWLLTHVWPRVRSRRPDASLVIAGTAPGSSLRRRAHKAGQVTVTGHVDDIRPQYWEAAVFVAPLHLARGVQNKVLDAVAAGVPAVVTTAVARGLPAAIMPACTIADDPSGFADAVCSLLERGAEERRALADRADLTAMSWAQRLAPLEPLLERARTRRFARSEID